MQYNAERTRENVENIGRIMKNIFEKFMYKTDLYGEYLNITKKEKEDKK